MPMLQTGGRMRGNMIEKEYTGQGYYLTYRELPEGVAVTGFGGRVLRAEVPALIEEKAVVKIEKKAFLSRKTLREISLPDCVQQIDDWAFAYCSNLERVTLPAGKFSVGRAVFLECSRLEQVRSSSWTEETANLLAAAVTKMDAYYLLDSDSIGSREWLKKWDAGLLAVMDAEDMEGYQNQILCGEEDYGSTDVGAFLLRKRMHKVRLAMLRLLNPTGLSVENRMRLVTYLKGHTKGCESEETWLTLFREYYDDLKRIQLFLDLGCAHEGNMEQILKDMGEEHPEMKAIFLRYQDTHIGYHDFFEDLTL